MDLILFIVFTLLGFAFAALDFYKDIPYLGVLGGVLLILMGTVLSFDIADITQTFCDTAYNYSGITCIDQKVNVTSTMNVGIGAMFWLVGVGIILDAAVFNTNRAKRE